MPARRVLAIAATALVSVGLVGCIQLPPPIAAPTPSPVESSTTPSTSPSPSTAPSPSATAQQEPEGDFGPFTVDDGAGDTWTYTVTGYELPANLSAGDPGDGMTAIALLLDATHDDGSASWNTCFEVTVTTDAGTFSANEGASLQVSGARDIFTESESFTDGQAVIVVPEGTTSGTFTVTSRFGDDERSFPFSE